MLYRRRGDDAHLLKRLLLRMRRVLSGPFVGVHLRWALDGMETFCRACGKRSVGGRTVAYSTERSGNAVKRLAARLRRSLPLAAAPRRNMPYEDAESRADLPRLLAGVAFPVYGLRSSSPGLRLQGVGGGKRKGRTVDRVRLSYAAGGQGGPRQAVELSQGVGATRESTEGRLSLELEAILGLVTSPRLRGAEAGVSAQGQHPPRLEPGAHRTR